MKKKVKTLFARLVEDELGFCCIYSFLKETKRYSTNKIAKAMGVSANTVKYWRDKRFLQTIRPCPSCHLPQTQLRLRKTSGGRLYFVRSDAH